MSRLIFKGATSPRTSLSSFSSSFGGFSPIQKSLLSPCFLSCDILAFLRLLFSSTSPTPSPTSRRNEFHMLFRQARATGVLSAQYLGLSPRWKTGFHWSACLWGTGFVMK